MTKEELIELLNDDLKNEYKHMHFYLHSSFLVVGLHRQEYRDHLFEHAKDEMEHVKQFAELIIGLGGEPTTESNDFPDLTCPKEILEYALQMEEEVVSNYTERMDQAVELGGVDGRYIEIFLEDQILDSRKDVDNLKQILAGC